MAGSRLYVQSGIHDEVVKYLGKRAAELHVGPGMEQATEIGPLISDHQLSRVLDYVDQGSATSTLVAGGHRLGGGLQGGYFVEPTVFSHVADSAAIASEEIFGPVLSVFPFESEDEVVTRANASPFGLAAGVWTNNLGTAHRMAARLKAGVVWVNTYDWFDPAVPFGGSGRSGIGRELGTQVIDMYTELKSVWIKID